MKIYCYLLIANIMCALLNMHPAHAQNAISITDQGATFIFPEQVTFKAIISSDAVIDQIVIEYGVEKRTCGTVTAKAFPSFTPSTEVNISWTWDMRKSGSEPPGSTLWYRWHVTDKAGKTGISEKRQLLWLDQQNNWTSLQDGNVVLHWYDQPEAFATDLLSSASESANQLIKTIGVAPSKPVDMYIYRDGTALHNAVLYTPGWTGGIAFPEYNLLVIGISPAQIDWGKRALAHELTHVLLGTLSSGCLSNIPTWLNEGIAVYSEGQLDTLAQIRLSSAIKDNKLVPLRALGGGFSEEPARANLAYSESYSVVNYLIVTFGEATLLKLFDQLQHGLNIEDALVKVYGFGLDKLDTQWHRSVGAQPPINR